MYPHPQEGMAPRTTRDDEVDIIGLIREWLEARELEGGMTGECRWMPDIEKCDEHHLPTRRRTVLHQQHVVAPLSPARCSELICTKERVKRSWSA